MAHFKVFICLLVIVFLVTTNSTIAAEDKSSVFIPGMMAEAAPRQLEHWGKMVGQWSTTEERLKQDGSGWQASKGADWDFLWAFNGWGIQDNYTSPPLSEKIADESQRQRGINLRIYNPKENKWILTWLTTSSSTPKNFTAASTEESIVMLSDKPDARGNHHRITFFDIAEESFEWKLEWSQDQTKWLEVYRIHGVRK